MNIVGLPETSVRESKDRVRSAIINCGYQFPAKRITVNQTISGKSNHGRLYDQ
ncbi:magnesium chelatase domain-containing protein [Colwellia sp. MB3u-55]|uniref:magnesium chelatase domain-containing protein n=1 Tax=Colwellia sp. MB3u-55 TaxID=2759810 RepID=UPI0038F739C7